MPSPLACHSERSEEFRPRPCKPVSARVRQWLLASGLALTAILMPLCFHGTEAGTAAWAWFLFFALVSVIAAFQPDTFLS